MQPRPFFITLFLLILASIIGFGTKAQQCTSGNPPTTVTLQCGNSCTDLHFVIPDIRETSNYLPIENRPFVPFLFDDRTVPGLTFTGPPNWFRNAYSGVQSLPFTFCFFDSTYDYLVVGANGCVSFDTSMAFKFCEPRVVVNNNPRPLPSTAYARALIAGVMQDLDPADTNRVVTGEKVEFRIVGTAPCRRAVISYSKIPIFWPPSAPVPCTAINTYQIVLHEGTGIVDIYVKDMAVCVQNGQGSNNGLSILAMQNWAQDFAVAPRQKNTGSWSGNNINYAVRFLPSGGASRFIRAELWDGPHIINTTTTVTPGATGELGVDFTAVCPPATTNLLILKSVYSSCTGTGTVELYDTVNIIHSTALNATAESIPASCGGTNGSVIVHVPPGIGVQPIYFSLNGGPPQRDSVFTGLAAGTYTVDVRDNSGCDSHITIQVRSSTVLYTVCTSDTTSCNLANDGSITVNVSNGNPPFTYVINGGPGQASNVFNNLAPGFYTIDVSDPTGCKSNSLVEVVRGGPLTVNVRATNTSCSGVNNGTVTVVPQNGSAPYQYSLNGGPYQASNVFTNLAVGSYTVGAIDRSGCSVANVPIDVLAGQPLSATAVKTDPDCNGGRNGTITVTVANGVAPFSYSLDNVTFQPGNIFNNLTAGNYTVYVNDNNSCSGTVNIVITEPSVLSQTLTVQNARCNGQANGSITVTGIGGTSPYQYSLDGVTYSAIGTFNNLGAALYTVYTKDSKGCITSIPVNITQPAPVQFSVTTQNASCGGGNDGKIIVTATGGSSTYQYSTDNTTFQTSNTLLVAPGTYTVYVKDQNGCTAPSQGNIVVGLSNTLAIRAIIDSTICLSKSVNLNAVSNATQYTWRPATGLNNPNIANPTATPAAPGTYTYIVDAVLGPCNGSDTVVINVLPAPVANAGGDVSVCYRDSIQMQGSGGVTYLWSPAIALSDANIANPFAKPTQTVTYSLLVTDANGCTSLAPDDVKVTVIMPPRVNITRNSYVSPGDVIRLHAEGGINYLWTPPTGLSDPTNSDPLATITQDITYKVLVTTAEGCKAEDSVSIKAFKGPEIYVPTAFTPNNDGKNDRFTPIPVGIKEITYFKIFNRWGHLVFSTTKMLDGWDGKYAGQPLDTGVFVWMVEGVSNDGNKIFKKGTVTLIR